MPLSPKRYKFTLLFQFLFLFIDLLLNSFSLLAKSDKLAIICLFLLQDLLLILSFTTFVFSMYSTYIYQAGVAEILYRKFRLPIMALTLYFILCVAYHVWMIAGENHNKKWSAGLTTLFIIQRLFSPIYYYLYKRSALRMCDPRFYDNTDWLAEQLAVK